MQANALKAIIPTPGRDERPEFLDTVCAQVTDDMLDEIARIDRGMDFDAHLAELEKLRDRNVSPDRMEWEPKEVLELFRWAEYGDNRTGRKPRTLSEFHLMRAFCCALILEAYVTPANNEIFFGINQTIIQLLESTRIIGPTLQEKLPKFFFWLIPQVPDTEDELPFFGLALIWAEIHASHVSSREARFIFSLIAACEADANTVQESYSARTGRRPERWLLGWTYHDHYHAKWTNLGLELATKAHAIEDGELRARLLRLSRWLSEDGAYREGA